MVFLPLKPDQDDHPFWRAYRHVAAVAGALSLANMARDIVAWREFVLSFLDGWAAIIRPIMSVLLGWFPLIFSVEVPDVIKDYFAVGLISTFSFARDFVISQLQAAQRQGRDFGAVTAAEWSEFIRAVMAGLFVWPAFYLYLMFLSLDEGPDLLLKVLLPFFYLFVLVSVNYALFFAN